VLVAGVDGCKGGWFVLGWDGKRRWNGWVCKRFEDLLRRLDAFGVQLVAVDVPIGLLDAPQRGGRECDRWARRVLGGGRGSSVFAPPARSVLEAASYEEAKRLSRPVGITYQAFCLGKKIREVDRLMTPRMQAVIKEVHPELGFFFAAGKRRLRSKKTEEGRNERVRILGKLLGEAWLAWWAYATRAFPGLVRSGDLLDATIAAWIAWKIAQGKARRFPERPERDAKGLCMEIWYAVP